MSFEKMAHMAKEVVKENDGGLAAAGPGEVPSGPQYPYSLAISLEDEQMEKLGLDCDDEDCQVGNYLHLEVLAEVTGYSKNKTSDGERRCLNLQITHMQINDGEETEEAEEEDHYDGKVLRAAGPY